MGKASKLFGPCAPLLQRDLRYAVVNGLTTCECVSTTNQVTQTSKGRRSARQEKGRAAAPRALSERPRRRPPAQWGEQARAQGFRAERLWAEPPAAGLLRVLARPSARRRRARAGLQGGEAYARQKTARMKLPLDIAVIDCGTHSYGEKWLAMARLVLS